MSSKKETVKKPIDDLATVLQKERKGEYAPGKVVEFTVGKRVKDVSPSINLSHPVAAMAIKEKIDTGELIPKEKLQSLIDEAIKKALEKPVKDFVPPRSKAQINDYLEKTGLTNENFASKLMNLHVNPEYARVLRDEHIKWEKEQIWDYIRAHYKTV